MRCRLCGVEVVSGKDLVSHWRMEVLKLGLEGVEGSRKEDEDIPHAELIPTLQEEEEEEVAFQGGKEENIDNCEIDQSLKEEDILDEKKETSIMRSCPLCEYTCDSATTLRQHKFRVHRAKDMKPLTCDAEDCDYTCDKPGTMQKHNLYKHKKNKCDLCDFRCPKKDRLLLHLFEEHDGPKPELRACDQCDYKSMLTLNLQRHKLFKHKGKKEVVKCTLCDYSCSRRGRLNVHMYKEHGEGDMPASMKAPKPRPWEANKVRRCSQCEYETPHKQRMSIHMFKAHGGPKPELRQCDQCDYKTMHTDTMQKHKLYKHEGKRIVVVCTLCGFSCSGRGILEVHLYKEHGEGDMPAPRKASKRSRCSQCEYESSSKQWMRIHMFKAHGGPEPEKHFCDECTFSAHTISRLNEHKKSVHSGKLKLQCDECPYTTRIDLLLRNHKLQVHGVESKGALMCHLCDYRTTVKKRLSSHIIAEHETQNMFYCDKCDFKTSSESSVKPHAKLHEKDTWLQCEYCAYRCSQRGNMKYHMDGRHNDITKSKYPCPSCDKEFKNRISLNQHGHYVHGGNTKRHLTCDLCGYKSIKGFLKKHYIAHHTKIRFKCPHCNYNTNWVADLTKHSKGQVRKQIHKISLQK